MFYKITWLLGAVLSPELIVAVAFKQWLEARETLASWKRNIGDEEAKRWLGMTGAFFAAMGGAPEKSVTTLRSAGFRKLLERQVINNLVNDGTLTETPFLQRNISDKGKADSVAKVLLCGQILWMCVQCLGRVLSGLPVTLLEGHVLIQILFAILAHICWWYKPLDVSEPIPLPIGSLLEHHPDYIHVSSGTAEPHVQCDLLTADVSVGGFFRMFFHTLYDVVSHHSQNFESIAALIGVLNGGLHLIAWNAHFPSHTERLLWRISASSAGGLFPIIILSAERLCVVDLVVRECLIMLLLGGNNNNWTLFSTHLSALLTHAAGEGGSWPALVPRKARRPISILACWGAGWYLLCMLYLTVAPFLSVRNLPKGAYSTVAWADFFPHF
ncbi:hypothetical protein BJX99DRAFT_256430 [Aspergillus californicus]